MRNKQRFRLVSTVAAFAIILCTLFAASAWPQAPQNTATANSARADIPILVELFTSEGCSSCPPADVALAKLETVQPVSSAQLIVLSEHVTYWDHDGWKDPNSLQALTDRQSSYESALGERDSYTPQFIVDGASTIRLDQLQQMEDVFNKAKTAPKLSVRIGDVEVDASAPGVLHASIHADESPDKHSADVYVALALNHVESQVLRGENGGRRLTHVAVVQQLVKVGKIEKGRSFDRAVDLKLKPGTDLKNLRLVAFVQEPGPGKVLGAAVKNPVN